MLRKIFWLLVTSGLATRALRHLGRRRIARIDRRLDRTALQRWEDEGGTPVTPRTQ